MIEHFLKACCGRSHARECSRGATELFLKLGSSEGQAERNGRHIGREKIHDVVTGGGAGSEAAIEHGNPRG